LLTKPAIQRATSAEEVAAGSAAMSVMPPAARPVLPPGAGGQAAAPPPAARPVLARGASGQAVATLQAALGAAMAMPLVADGEYGLQTAALVCLLQRSLGLKVDGMVGPETWLSL